MELDKAVVAGKVPLTFIEPNLRELEALGKVTAGSANVAGVYYVNEKVVSVR